MLLAMFVTVIETKIISVCGQPFWELNHFKYIHISISPSQFCISSILTSSETYCNLSNICSHHPHSQNYRPVLPTCPLLSPFIHVEVFLVLKKKEETSVTLDHTLVTIPSLSFP